MVFTKDKSFYVRLFSLALPISLQGLLTFAVGLTDNIMIGRLGDGAVSGVYLGGQIQLLLQILSIGVEGALLLLSAQHWGKRDTEAVSKISAIGMRTSALLGLSFTAVCALFPRGVLSLFTSNAAAIKIGSEYLSILAFSFVFFAVTQSLIAAMRSIESPGAGLAVSSVSLVLNIFLNYVLIFGKLGAPALGVRGAAIATLISRICELLVAVLCLFVLDKKLKLSPKILFVRDRELRLKFFKYGLPVMGGQLVWALNSLASSAIMGRLPESGVLAGLSVANALGGLSYVVTTGMSGALAVITGKTVGRGKGELMREYAKTAQVIFIVLGALTSALLLFTAEPFLSLYGTSPEAKSHAMKFIRVLALTSIGTSYQSACLFGLIKSGGDSAFSFKCDLFFVLFATLPLSLVALRLSLPAWAVFFALKCDQLLKCVAAGIKVNKFNWIKDLTGRLEKRKSST